jgi:hypothetical protein
LTYKLRTVQLAIDLPVHHWTDGISFSSAVPMTSIPS